MANTRTQNLTITAAFSFIALTGGAIFGWDRIDGLLHSELAQASELQSANRKIKINSFSTEQNRYSILNIALDHKRELLAKINLAPTQGGMTPALEASKQDIESSIRKIQVEINVILRK